MRMIGSPKSRISVGCQQSGDSSLACKGNWKHTGLTKIVVGAGIVNVELLATATTAFCRSMAQSRA